MVAGESVAIEPGIPVALPVHLEIDAPAQNNNNSSRRFYGGIKIAMITNRSKMSRLVVDAVALQSNEYCYSPPLRVLRVG